MLKAVGDTLTNRFGSLVNQASSADASLQKIAFGAIALLAGLAAVCRRGSGPITIGTVVAGAAAMAWGITELWGRAHEDRPTYGPQNLCDAVPTFCDGHLGIFRRDMPQFSEPVKAAYEAWWIEQGVSIERGCLNASRFKATQNEINFMKVHGMLARFHRGEWNTSTKQILASADGYVLDGHHRWAVCRLAEIPVNATVVNAPIKELLETAAKFEGVTNYDLENRVP